MYIPGKWETPIFLCYTYRGSGESKELNSLKFKASCMKNLALENVDKMPIDTNSFLALWIRHPPSNLKKAHSNRHLACGYFRTFSDITKVGLGVSNTCAEKMYMHRWAR